MLLRPGSIASPAGRTRCRGFLEDGYSIQAADMPGVNDLMMRIYATMAQTFAAACLDGAPSPSSAAIGVRIVRMLEAAQKSLGQQGARIVL